VCCLCRNFTPACFHARPLSLPPLALSLIWRFDAVSTRAPSPSRSRRSTLQPAATWGCRTAESPAVTPRSGTLVGAVPVDAVRVGAFGFALRGLCVARPRRSALPGQPSSAMGLRRSPLADNHGQLPPSSVRPTSSPRHRPRPSAPPLHDTLGTAPLPASPRCIFASARSPLSFFFFLFRIYPSPLSPPFQHLLPTIFPFCFHSPTNLGTRPAIEPRALLVPTRLRSSRLLGLSAMPSAFVLLALSPQRNKYSQSRSRGRLLLIPRPHLPFLPCGDSSQPNVSMAPDGHLHEVRVVHTSRQPGGTRAAQKARSALLFHFFTSWSCSRVFHLPFLSPACPRVGASSGWPPHALVGLGPGSPSSMNGSPPFVSLGEEGPVDVEKVSSHGLAPVGIKPPLAVHFLPRSPSLAVFL